mgnify:CR=1 FL=1
MAVVAGNSSWMLISASLVLLMTPALALFYGGMSSRRSVLNMMMMSFGSFGLIGILYVLYGYSMSFGTHDIAGLIANPGDKFGLHNVADVFNSFGYEGYGNIPELAFVGFQLTFAGLTVALISGAIAERVRFGTWLAFAGLWAEWEGNVAGEEVEHAVALEDPPVVLATPDGVGQDADLEAVRPQALPQRPHLRIGRRVRLPEPPVGRQGEVMADIALTAESTTLPPDTNTTGMLIRMAAISIPGVILSQLEMHTSASAQWALHMYSTLSAMISRLGSE